MSIDDEVQQNAVLPKTIDTLTTSQKTAKAMDNFLSELPWGCITGLGTYLWLLNFGLISSTAYSPKATWHPNPKHYFEKKQIKEMLDKMNPEQKAGYLVSFYTGGIIVVEYETLFALGLTTLFGLPGLGVYVGAKAVTNTMGYFYYKKKQQVQYPQLPPIKE